MLTSLTITLLRLIITQGVQTVVRLGLLGHPLRIVKMGARDRDRVKNGGT